MKGEIAKATCENLEGLSRRKALAALISLSPFEHSDGDQVADADRRLWQSVHSLRAAIFLHRGEFYDYATERACLSIIDLVVWVLEKEGTRNGYSISEANKVAFLQAVGEDSGQKIWAALSWATCVSKLEFGNASEKARVAQNAIASAREAREALWLRICEVDERLMK